MGDASPSAPSGVVAFLLTDIEGSTHLWQRHPERMSEAIARHDEILGAAISANQGRVLTERGEGDSFFAVFGRASQALAAARDIQRTLHAEAWPAEAPVRVRIAINTGEAGGDYRGLAANRSARIRQLARGGQVLLSQSTQSLVRDHLPEGVQLADFGRHRLRGVDQPERVFEARISGLAAPRHAPPPGRRRPLLALLALVPIAGGIAFAAVALRPHHAAPPVQTAGARVTGPVPLADRKIVTVAGDGAEGYALGLTSATDAELDHPQGLAVDPTGDVFISDTGNNRVRELTGGTLTDIAGGGTATAAIGEGGTDIRLNHPTGLTYDPVAGNLYIADTGDNRVLRLDKDRHIWLVAGSGAVAITPQTGPAATVGLDAPTGVLVLELPVGAAGRTALVTIINSGNGSIQGVDEGSLEPAQFGKNGYEVAPPVFARGGVPSEASLTQDAGSIPFYSNTNGNQVIVALGAYATATPFAGTGAAGSSGDGGPATAAELNGPEGIALNGGAYDLLIADTGNDAVREVDNGKIESVAGELTVAGFAGDGGAAGHALLDQPAAVAVDAKGDVFIADTLNNRIREIIAA